MNQTANIDQWVFRIAGLFILLSATLSVYHHPYWIGLTIFVGLNLLQTSFTGLCPLVWVLRRLKIKEGAAFCNKSSLP